MIFLKKGVPTSAGICAEVDGEYKGVVYHDAGGIADKAISEKDVNVVPAPIWAVGNAVRVKLLGKLPLNAKAALVRVLEVTEARAESAVDME